MKIILTGILCLFFAASSPAQTEINDETENATVEVAQISLLRDDGAGKAGDETENFSAAEKILHFRIQLSSQKPAAIKMILVAAAVAGLKSESRFITVSYQTNGSQNIVNFTASPEDEWRAGKYRADIFVDGKLAGKKEFAIQDTAPKIEKGKQPPPEARKKRTPKPLQKTKKT